MFWVLFLITTVTISAEENITLLDKVLCDAVVPESIIDPMIEDLLTNGVKRHQHIVVLIRDKDIDASVVTKTTPSRLILSGGDPVEAQKKAMGTTAIIGSKSVEKVLREIAWTASTRFYVILHQNHYNDELFMPDMDQLGGPVKKVDFLRDLKQYYSIKERKTTKVAMQQTTEFLMEFWSHGVVNVIVVVPKKTNVYFYSFFPYTQHHCGDEVVPVLFNVWFSSNRTLYKRMSMFPDKTVHLFGCPVYISLILHSPGVIVNGSKIEGVEVEILNAVFDEMNATARYRFIPTSDGNKSTTGMDYILNDLNSGRSDFGAGLLIPTFPHSHITEDINFCIMMCLTWVVPRRTKFDDFTFGFITHIFTLPLWILTAGSFLFSSAILFFLVRSKKWKHASFVFSIFHIVSATLGKSFRLPQPLPAQFFVISYIWFAFVMGSAFQARLGSQGIAPDPPTQLESTEDVIESGLLITSFRPVVHLFKKDILLVRNNGDVLGAEPMDTKVALERVANDKNTAYIGLQATIRYHARFMKDWHKVLHLQRRCMVKYHTFLALRKNSPFTQNVNRLVFVMIESGIKEMLYRKHHAAYHRMREIETPHLDSSVAMTAFKLWAGGMLLSVVTFILELLRSAVTKWKMRGV